MRRPAPGRDCGVRLRLLLRCGRPCQAAVSIGISRVLSWRNPPQVDVVCGAPAREGGAEAEAEGEERRSAVGGSLLALQVL